MSVELSLVYLIKHNKYFMYLGQWRLSLKIIRRWFQKNKIHMATEIKGAAQYYSQIKTRWEVTSVFVAAEHNHAFSCHQQMLLTSIWGRVADQLPRSGHLVVSNERSIGVKG